jgi:hypothetical protein
LQVPGQAVDDGVAPTLGLLAQDDALADVPVQPEEFAVDRDSRPELGGVDALLEVAQEGVITLGKRRGRRTACRKGLVWFA